jgi:hypothetical protein
MHRYIEINFIKLILRTRTLLCTNYVAEFHHQI